MIHELKKVITIGIGIVLLLCVAINGFLFHNQQTSRYNELLADYPYYLELVDSLQQNPQKDLSAGLGQSEHGVATYIADAQQKYLKLYPEFILTMPDRAEQASRLSATGSTKYSQRNIDKTEQDFDGMETLPIKIDPELAITGVYGFVLSDILLLAFVLILCVKLFSHEYDNKLFSLILATPSRLKIALHKLFTLFLLTFVLSFLIYGVNLFIGGALFGFGDLSRPIQSISEFRTCSLSLSCLEYIGLGFLIKLFVAFAFGLIAFMLFTLLKKAIAVFLALSLFLGGSFALYASIHATSNLNALHFVNAFHLMDSMAIISHYQNINLFSFAVSMTTILPIFIGLLIICCCTIVILQFQTSNVTRSVKQFPFLSRIADKLSKVLDRMNYHTSLLGHELKKVFIDGKGIVVILALGVLLVYSYQTAYRFQNPIEKEYSNYIEEIGGRVTADTQQFFEEEWDFLSKVENPDMYVNRMQALNIVQEQVDAVLQNEAQNGIPAYLVDETSYLKLIGDKNSETYDSVVILLVMILCCGGIFAKENTFGTKRLLRICPLGNRLLTRKFTITVTLGLITALAVSMTRYAIVIKDYIINYTDAPIQSISLFYSFGYPIRIFDYLILFGFTRLIGSVLIGFVICMISSYCKNDSFAICSSIVLLVVPIVATWAGVEILTYVSMFQFAGDNTIGHLWYVIFIILGIGSSIFLTKKQWRNGMPQKTYRRHRHSHSMKKSHGV